MVERLRSGDGDDLVAQNHLDGTGHWRKKRWNISGQILDDDDDDDDDDKYMIIIWYMYIYIYIYIYGIWYMISIHFDDDDDDDDDDDFVILSMINSSIIQFPVIPD